MSDAPPPSAAPVERRRSPRRWRRARRALIGILAIVALGLVGNLALSRIGGPRVASVSPLTTRVGDTVTLTGRGFGPTLEGNVVYFGDYAGRMVKASRTRLEVEVPDVGVPEGQQERVPVKVEVEEKEVSNVVELVVLPPAEPEPGTDPLTEEEAETPPLPTPTPRAPASRRGQ